MRLFKSKKTIQPLPFIVYTTTFLTATVLGIVVTLYLAYSHYRVYSDIGYKSFCAISRAINCDTVSQSAYAHLLGVPVAVWGAVGYFLVLVFFLLGCRSQNRPQRMWAILQILAFLFCVFDLYLAWISTYRIGSYCIMCILTYGVNFTILYFAWLIRRRFNKGSLIQCLRADIDTLRRQAPSTILLGTLFITMVVSVVALYPAYWQYSLPSAEVSVHTGVDTDGRPWIGAQHPTLVIEEYSDYLCFQCAKMHSYLRELVMRYPDKLRLVHYHFPMDKAYNPLVQDAFHKGSGRMALLALYAEKHNRFWKMNDLLFENGRRHTPVSLRKLSAALKLDFPDMARAHKDPELLRRLWQDIRSGLKYHITATPSFVIDGVVYQGVIPADVLKRIID
jgi:uncharacterized membrane protein/protein-disulfide isomerase